MIEAGNGADLGHVIAMLGNVITAQQEMRAEIRDLRTAHGRKLDGLSGEISELRTEMTELRSEVRAEISGLRQALIEYHSAVMGHGILISELEAACAASSSI